MTGSPRKSPTREGEGARREIAGDVETVPARREKYREKETKGCRKCGQLKPVSEFRRNPRCRDGLSSWCSECHNAASQQWRARKRAEKEAETYRRAEPLNAALRAQTRARRRG